VRSASTLYGEVVELRLDDWSVSPPRLRARHPPFSEIDALDASGASRGFPGADRRIDAMAMKLFMFTSQAKADLHAFAAESAGGKLPAKFGPWTATGVVRADQMPPHRYARRDIEKAIEASGFQLWRRPAPEKADG
jgi:hypothetical protein